MSEACRAVRRIAQSCPSTAMILAMHYSATAVLEKFGDGIFRRGIRFAMHDDIDHDAFDRNDWTGRL